MVEQVLIQIKVETVDQVPGEEAVQAQVQVLILLEIQVLVAPA
jgi:hypothetical protein